MNNQRIAWHYTILGRVVSIMSDGILKPATSGVPVGERPVVWFSTHQTWEQTATKGIIGPDGVRRQATWAEMVDEGPYRFGLPTQELVPWERLKAEANIDPGMLRGLARAARGAGANPADWYGSFEPVSISRCKIELWDDDTGQWVPSK